MKRFLILVLVFGFQGSCLGAEAGANLVACSRKYIFVCKECMTKKIPQSKLGGGFKECLHVADIVLKKAGGGKLPTYSLDTTAMRYHLKTCHNDKKGLKINEVGELFEIFEMPRGDAHQDAKIRIKEEFLRLMIGYEGDSSFKELLALEACKGLIGQKVTNIECRIAAIRVEEREKERVERSKRQRNNVRGPGGTREMGDGLVHSSEGEDDMPLNKLRERRRRGGTVLPPLEEVTAEEVMALGGLLPLLVDSGDNVTNNYVANHGDYLSNPHVSNVGAEAQLGFNETQEIQEFIDACLRGNLT